MLIMGGKIKYLKIAVAAHLWRGPRMVLQRSAHNVAVRCPLDYCSACSACHKLSALLAQLNTSNLSHTHRLLIDGCKTSVDISAYIGV